MKLFDTLFFSKKIFETLATRRPVVHEGVGRGGGISHGRTRSPLSSSPADGPDGDSAKLPSRARRRKSEQARMAPSRRRSSIYLTPSKVLSANAAALLLVLRNKAVAHDGAGGARPGFDTGQATMAPSRRGCRGRGIGRR
jgi:hypothetical protein